MLPLKNRLEKKHFKPLFLKGKKNSYADFNLIYKESGEGIKAGFVVSSSVSKHAAHRNRIKRRARNVVLGLLHEFNAPCLMIFLFKKEVLKANFNKLKEEIVSALREVKLIK